MAGTMCRQWVRIETTIRQDMIAHKGLPHDKILLPLLHPRRNPIWTITLLLDNPPPLFHIPYSTIFVWNASYGRVSALATRAPIGPSIRGWFDGWPDLINRSLNVIAQNEDCEGTRDRSTRSFLMFNNKSLLPDVVRISFDHTSTNTGHREILGSPGVSWTMGRWNLAQGMMVS